MSRSFHIPHDPVVDQEIRETLAAGAEPEPLKLPKPTRLESLSPWRINPVAKNSPSKRPSRFARGHMPSQDTLYALEAAREGWN